MGKPLLLDCFSSAGGCTKGYQQAGFYVAGIDIEPQPHYCGDDFIQMDAIEALKILNKGGCITGKNGRYYLSDFTVVHASPPCQVHSVLSHLANSCHVDLIPQTRRALKVSGVPYVIENVPGAPLENPIVLCGTSFGLGTTNAQLIRHRLFETYPKIWMVPPCSHQNIRTIGIFGSKARDTALEKQHYKKPKHTRGAPPHEILFTLAEAREAMGIDWMTQKELSQAIPPAYCEWIGKQLIKQLYPMETQ